MPARSIVHMRCLSCGCDLKYTQHKFCSNTCQQRFQYEAYVERWKAGLETGRKGNHYAMSDYVRRWMRETRGERCAQCGWAERNPWTGNIPLEIDHIDGDAANCRPDNLRFLCPNCHSLTATFGRLNKGKGLRPARGRRKFNE